MVDKIQRWFSYATKLPLFRKQITKIYPFEIRKYQGRDLFIWEAAQWFVGIFFSGVSRMF